MDSSVRRLFDTFVGSSDTTEDMLTPEPFTDRIKVFALEIDREAERSETLNMNDVDNFILYVYV
jgi:hypothetical protein